MDIYGAEMFILVPFGIIRTSKFAGHISYRALLLVD